MGLIGFSRVLNILPLPHPCCLMCLCASKVLPGHLARAPPPPPPVITSPALPPTPAMLPCVQCESCLLCRLVAPAMEWAVVWWSWMTMGQWWWVVRSRAPPPSRGSSGGPAVRSWTVFRPSGPSPRSDLLPLVFEETPHCVFCQAAASDM